MLALVLALVLILLVVAIGGLVEIVPLFFQRSTTQAIEGVKARGDDDGHAARRAARRAPRRSRRLGRAPWPP